MHLLDTYALSAGAKIDKPYIFEQYFPLAVERYITIQAQSKYESKDYDYWQDVINLLAPVLEKAGIKICQVGGPNELLYQHVIDLRGKTDFNQLAYVIKNSLLHVGPDSIGVHLASSYDIPILGLYSVSQVAVSGPRFGNKDKQICIESFIRSGIGKPSYSSQESPKTINLIRPEEIADGVFQLLNFKDRVPFKTIFVGSKYSSKYIREFVPSKSQQIGSPETPIEIRMDLHFDEKVLEEQLNLCKAIIVTNKRVNKEILKRFKANIAALLYIIEEDDEPSFITDIRDLAFPIVLLSRLSEERIQPKKINYYEQAAINIVIPEQPEKWDEIKKNIDKIYFKSNKMIFENGLVFNSNICRVKKESIVNDYDYYKAIDIPEFWNELPFLTLVMQET